MKYWIDTEFIENGKTIDIVSIGIVAEDGRTYYCENSDCDHQQASEWVERNVLTHLTGPFKPKEVLKQEILEFVGNDSPEFWADWGAYDWVVLCQIFGTMMDLPKGWPMFIRDIQQLRQHLGYPDTPEQVGTEHNALADAQHCKVKYDFLMKL